MPRSLYAFSCLASAVLLTLSGCGASTPLSGPRPLHAQPTQPDSTQRDPLAMPGSATPAADSPEMRQMLARLESLERDNAQLNQRLSEQYMEAIALRRLQQEAQRNGGGAVATQPVANGATSNPATATAQPQADLRQQSSAALFDALAQRIASTKDSDRVKALKVAALSVADPTHELDHRLLDQLDPRSREQVARFQQMLAVTYDELAGDPGKTLTRREMIARIDEVFGAQPLKIEALELCRRVDSYGVYEPFGSKRFLAGRKNRLLVYVELENFRHEPTADGQYEVKLEQSVELYDATGETTVWRQGPVQLVDLSRNKRRDFFVVYPIDLPARLTAGAYRLKVRVADKHTGSICEKTLHDIQIVADSSLVNGGG